MTVDALSAGLGEMGVYQVRVFLLLSPAAMSCGIQVMISVFNMGVPDHRCAIPGYPQDTWRLHSEEHATLVNHTIPRDPEVTDKGGYSRCSLYFQQNATSEVQVRQCSRFVYDPTTYASSAVTKWDLVCERKLYRSHARMILMGGLLLGAIVTGIVADIIGRKLALMAMVALHAASSIAVAWAPSFVTYVILRCITGATISGLFLVVFVLAMELVGPLKRCLVGMVSMVLWSLGVMVLGGMAYFLRHWDTLQKAVSLPSLLLLSYWWLIPESPRWLLARGRFAEAEVIIRRAAHVNRVKLPAKLFDTRSMEQAKGGNPGSESGGASGDDGGEKFWHIFFSPVLMARTLILCFNWLVCSMVYYGLSLNAGSLGGSSVYVSFQLLAAVELVAYVLCLLLLNRLGRKAMHVASMVLGGTACLGTIPVLLYAGLETRMWLTVSLALVGKLGAAAAFAIVYVFSAELFPTLLRNSLMGVASLCARVGGMVSPYIAELNDLVGGGELGQALPLLVFGSTTVVAGLLCLWLPETLHRRLPETLQDAKMFGRMDTRDSRPRPETWDLEYEVDGAQKESCHQHNVQPTAGSTEDREPLTSSVINIGC